MKKTLILVVLGFLLFASAQRSWAAGACVTVATTAGGTNVVAPGNKYVEWLVNNGTNIADCVCNTVANGTAAGGIVPTSTNYQFQLAASGGTWVAPGITYAPNEVNAPRIACTEGVACLAITGSTTVCYYGR